MRASQGCMRTCDCPEELRMSSNEKGASKTVKFLAAETKPCGENPWFIGLEQTEDTKCHDQERDWSIIHSEVKEAKSMKSHSGGVGSRMEQDKEGKKLLPLSLSF